MEVKNYNYFHKKETLMIFMYYQQEKSQGFHILWFLVSFQKWYIKRVYSQCGGQAKHTFTCNFKKFMIQSFMLSQKSLSWFCCRCKRNSGFHAHAQNQNKMFVFRGFCKITGFNYLIHPISPDFYLVI